MKARKNPTDEQLKRRLRRAPVSDDDPRYKTDPYWALRKEGLPHNHAKRAYRDQPPVFHEREVSADAGGCDPDDLLFPAGSTWTELEVAIRPLLSEQNISALEARESEYTAWDHEVPGMGVRVRASGYKTFVVHCRPRNTRKLLKHTIGKVANFSLDEARRLAQVYLRTVRPDDEPSYD